MRIGVTVLNDSDQYDQFIRGRVEYLAALKKMMQLKASLRALVSKPYLATEVHLIMAGKTLDEMPYDPKIKPRLMVSIVSISTPKDDKERLIHGVYRSGGKSYYTKLGNKRVHVRSKTTYYRIKPDGTFFHRKGQTSLKSLYHNYPAITEAISKLLEKL